MKRTTKTPGPGLRLALAVAVLLGTGCGLVTIESSGSRPQPPAPRTAARRPAHDAEITSAKVPALPTSAPEPAVSCPGDLSTQPPPRTVIVDGRFVTPVSDAQYSSFRWAPGHGKAPDAAFFRSREQAVSTVLAVEAKHPALVPAGFRDELAKAPRDAELRLRMARCEVREAPTHRRGAVDAAMAALLGASAVSAGRVLVSDAEFRMPSLKSCEYGARCAAGVVCKEKICLDAALKEEIMLSEPELAIEDALTRALMKDFYDAGSEWPEGFSLRARMTDANLTPSASQALSRPALVIWGRNHVHKCGGVVCKFEGAQTAKGVPLPLTIVDLRDHGSAGPTLGIVGVDENKCFKATGFPYSDDCLGNCREQGLQDDPACTTKCYMPYCKRRPY